MGSFDNVLNWYINTTAPSNNEHHNFFRSVVLALRKNYGNRKSTRNKCLEEGENSNAEDGIHSADKDDDKVATSSDQLGEVVISDRPK